MGVWLLAENSESGGNPERYRRCMRLSFFVDESQSLSNREGRERTLKDASQKTCTKFSLFRLTTYWEGLSKSWEKAKKRSRQLILLRPFYFLRKRKRKKKMKKQRFLVLALTVLMVLACLTGCGKKTDGSKFSLVGDSVHGEDGHAAYETWFSSDDLAAGDDTSALDVIRAGLEKEGYTFADESYIYSVTKPDGSSLSAGDNGPNSGWFYAVNGLIPDVAMNEYKIQAGDEVVLRFVDDYNTGVDWETGSFIEAK